MTPGSAQPASRLPGANEGDPQRRLAWVNSIGLLFLAIGILGARRADDAIKPLPSLEETPAALIEPLTPPPPPLTESSDAAASDEDKPEVPQVVIVTLDTPSIDFAVPTMGNLLVPNALATAPPLMPLRAPAPLTQMPIVLTNTGASGDRPSPEYPRAAIEQHQEGLVTLALTVDDSGRITDIQVKSTSGSPLLDRHTLDFVQRHWTIPPGQGTRHYEVPIRYRLRKN